MYARSTTIQGDPQRMDDAIAYVRDKVMPAVAQMDGCIGLSMLCDRMSGRCIVTTSWADADAMHRSAEGVMSMRQRTAEMMGGSAEVAEWEIALLHRLHEAPEGACTRVTWTRGDPADMDRLIDTFRMAMLPRLDEISGFCSVSMLCDRQSGMCAVAATYENRSAMDMAAETVRSMREQLMAEMNGELLEVAEFDLVLAHLRVPETV